MPSRITKLVERVHDAVDEWNERMEDDRTGRRNKYGLKTALWYEEEERKQRRRHRRRHQHSHRNSSRHRDRKGGEEQGTHGEEDPAISGGNREPPGEEHEQGVAPDGVEGAQRDGHHRRRSHRSRSRDGHRRHRRHHRHSSRSGSRNQGEGQQPGQRRTRGEDDSQSEILQHSEESQDREMPQTDGAGDQDDRSRGQGPQVQRRRHPKMKPYDDGGLADLVKAIVANLKEEQARRKSKNVRSQRSDRRGRDREGSRRPPRKATSAPPMIPPDEFIAGPEYRIEPEDHVTLPPKSPAHSEGHVTPPEDPFVDVERTQQEEIDAEHALEASMHREEGPETPEDPALEAERRQQEEIDAALEGSSHGPRHASVESAYASRASQHRTARAQTGNPLSAATLPVRSAQSQSRERPASDTASATASTHALAPASATRLNHPRRHLSLETDVETSEFQDSRDETARSVASTRATVPSSIPSQRRQSPGYRGDSLAPGHASNPSTYAGTVASTQGPASTRGSGGNGRRAGGRGRSGGSRPSGIRGGGGDDNEYEYSDDEYDDEQSSDIEIIDEPPLNRCYGPSNGKPIYWNPPTGHQDWYNEGFQAYQSRVRWTGPVYVKIKDDGRPQPPPRVSHPLPQPTKSSWNPFSGVGGGSGQQTRGPRPRNPDSYAQGQYPGSGPSSGRYGPNSSKGGPQTAFAGYPSHLPNRNSREQRQNSNGQRAQASGKRPTRDQGPRVKSRYSASESSDSDSDSDTSRRSPRRGKPRRDQDRYVNLSEIPHSESETEPESGSQEATVAVMNLESRSSKDNRRKPNSRKPSSSEDSESSEGTDSDGTAQGPSCSHSRRQRPPPPRSGDHERQHRGKFYNPPQKERTNYYAILGVTSTATTEQIKTAAKKMRIAMHPDKVAGFNEMTTEQKAAINDRAAKVGQAADVLLDPAKRRRYDRGEEV